MRLLERMLSFALTSAITSTCLPMAADANSMTVLAILEAA